MGVTGHAWRAWAGVWVAGDVFSTMTVACEGLGTAMALPREPLRHRAGHMEYTEGVTACPNTPAPRRHAPGAEYSRHIRPPQRLPRPVTSPPPHRHQVMPGVVTSPQKANGTCLVPWRH